MKIKMYLDFGDAAVELTEKCELHELGETLDRMLDEVNEERAQHVFTIGDRDYMIEFDGDEVAGSWVRKDAGEAWARIDLDEIQ